MKEFLLEKDFSLSLERYQYPSHRQGQDIKLYHLSCQHLQAFDIEPQLTYVSVKKVGFLLPFISTPFY
jgi:hypothetical protein